MADIATTNPNRATGRFQNYDEYTVSAASGALAQTLNLGKDCFLVEARLHLASAATQESFIISLSNVNTNLNHVLLTQAMSTVANVIWVSDRDEGTYISARNSIVFTFTNTDNRAWGLSVIVRRSAE